MGEGLKIHRELQQGSDEWLAARCGLMTASEVKLILTEKTLKVAANEKTRQHLYELAAQRITQYVEPSFIGDDMLRGQMDEIEAVAKYSLEVSKVELVGFMTNDKWGFKLGYSPDGLVGDDGLVECKSRRQKYQVQTIVEHVATGSASTPSEYMLQLQTGLLVSERKWIDFISYSGGLPMCVIRVHPDAEVQNAILDAAEKSEAQIQKIIGSYRAAADLPNAILFPTERKNYEDILA